ncbi:MAG: hypothetical protein DWQ44_04155 [Bacteroidetes bacterium]|nr:MAG: hypothetical protein DWQ33_13830 [Bacteroidota bacterium]REK00380.1 MAG: hypothetical protein DWQ39_12050 [Bacteroidota bacterium]REK35499.1 MAG: hypothetical protein DWQ44_04155 [Bacteroidota bacterium]REK50170.1 MAG: hypothetical protein DWQ48_05120 [Bacteroidota bacterium]
MKKVFYFIAIATALSFAACKSNEKQEKAAAASEVTSEPKKASSQYSCPMHPEVMSESPGQCPHCGMDLEVKS